MARYSNPHLRDQKRTLWDFFLWKIGYYRDSQRNLLRPKEFVYPESLARFDRAKPWALWIGHSTFLIQVGGLSFLTDPVWGNYCSPVPIPALRRKIAPPLLLHQLPKIDYVLLSHNHYDHLDAKTVATLRRLQPQIEWILPASLTRWFSRRGIFTVRELKWWENWGDSKLSITAVPTQHFSGRTLWDKNKTHWNGYVVETCGKRFYFTGDTGYNPYDFRDIGAHWNGMDLSLIPIGAYVPKSFMQPVHISPQEAVEIHQDVGSKFSLGMHWKTFRLSDEPPNAPPYDLYLAMQEKKLPFSTFLPIHPGTYINW